jgi:hypothetical protein
MMLLWANCEKKIIFFAPFKSMKKIVGSGVGSGSNSQRDGSGDPDPHQNVTDPQHSVKNYVITNFRTFSSTPFQNAMR